VFTQGVIKNMEKLQELSDFLEDQLEKLNKIKIEIQSAREVYPNCSNKFACGVHKYLNGESKPMRPEEDDVIRGYWQASDDNLKDKFILI